MKPSRNLQRMAPRGVSAAGRTRYSDTTRYSVLWLEEQLNILPQQYHLTSGHPGLTQRFRHDDTALDDRAYEIRERIKIDFCLRRISLGNLL